jgi:L-alanine-DL-glutamate epimerase-like enolase superfamily enzyme
MRLTVETFTVHKCYALTISRGATASSKNLWLRLEADGIEGWGEASPFSTGTETQTTDQLVAALQHLAPHLEGCHPLERQHLEALLVDLPSGARAAVDLALWDWLGKATHLPLWRLWGLDVSCMPPLSVTVGIASPEQAVARLEAWLALVPSIQLIKVKLGSPAGIVADQQMFSALQATAPDLDWMVDANGGWDLASAITMLDWLAERKVQYIEQPLAKGQEALLPSLREQSRLPIFLDESCWTSKDIPALADRADGINIKLLKAGGLSEALRMIHTARAHGLQVMFGCYSDSSLLNSAAAQLGPLADWLDLDSHLNLRDDPFAGVRVEAGRLQLGDRPGLGVTRSEPVE